MIHSHPQSSGNTFGTPINTDPDNKEGTTLFRETLFNPVMSNPIEHIHIFFPLNSFCNPPVQGCQDFGIHQTLLELCGHECTLLPSIVGEKKEFEFGGNGVLCILPLNYYNLIFLACTIMVMIFVGYFDSVAAPLTWHPTE